MLLPNCLRLELRQPQDAIFVPYILRFFIFYSVAIFPFLIISVVSFKLWSYYYLFKLKCKIYRTVIFHILLVILNTTFL